MRVPKVSSAVRSFFQTSLFLLVCLFSCAVASAQQQTTTATLVGQLRVTRQGSPPMQILVRLERSGAQVGESYSDPEGKFSFDDLPGNVYHVVIRHEGYRPVEMAVDINPSTQHLVYMHIELVPDEKSEAAQPTLKGSNSAMVDESSLVEKFPKDAKKQYEKGTKAQREGKSQQAIEHYERALEIAPAMYFARNNLASLYLENQRFGEAETELRKVIAEHQADANAYFNLANVYLLTGRLNEAADSIQEGLQRQPRSAFGEFLMGSMLVKKGKAREAEERFRVALNVDPGLANAHLALVNLYIRENRKAEAVQELSLFLKQSPESPFAPHARELVKKLQPKDSQ